eukprot:m.96474 g.96474  ORF g.96474 m.96474 type:complete len:1516 (+) comp36911_c0_seq7:44-4591(+)
MPFNWDLFCLKRLLYVTPSKHAGPDETIPASIELAAWRQSGSLASLALAVNNNNLILRVCLHGQKPVTKLVPWFEHPNYHLAALDFNSTGQWLVCVCTDGSSYLVPSYCLVTGSRPSSVFGSLTDLTVVQTSEKDAHVLTAVWWETHNEKQVLITGSKTGKITFIDLLTKQKIQDFNVPGCIVSLELLGRTASKSTFLLIKLKEGHSLRMLIEALAEGKQSFSDLSLRIPSSVERPVTRFVTCLDEEEMAHHFQPNQLKLLHMDVQLSSQRKISRSFLAGHDLITQRFELMNADVDLQGQALFTYTLVRRVTKLLFTNTIIFALCEEKGRVTTLNIISSHLAASVEPTNEPPREDPRQSDSVVQSFNLPENETVLYLFHQEPTTPFDMSQEIGLQTVLESCLIVTNRAVYQCRQKLHPEKIFLELASSPKTIDLSDRLGIAIQLDICGLYGMAAENQLKERNYTHALTLLQLAQWPSEKIARALIREGQMNEIMVYLQQVLSGQEIQTPSDPKQLSNLLLHCFVQQLLKLPEGEDSYIHLTGKLSQFINDNFLYDDQSALELLASRGFTSLTFQVAKARAKVMDALEILIKQGTLTVQEEHIFELKESDHGLALAKSYDGILLRCLAPEILARFVLLQPELVPPSFPRLFEILPDLKQETLLRFARFFDPSKSFVRPLLSRTTTSSRSKRLSTSSLLSMSSLAISTSQEPWNQPFQEDYFDLFLLVILTLKLKRKKENPVDSSFLLASIDRDLAPLATIQNLGEMRRRAMTQSATIQVSPLACGSTHAAVVIDGDVYTWGQSKDGRLGTGDIVADGGKLSSPLRVEILHMMGTRVLAVSCGAEHTIALCTDGVYTWGSSKHGQLGLGDTRSQTRPVRVAELTDKVCLAVVCGQYHSLALTQDRKTWSWGWNVHGQLGLGHVEDMLTPAHIKTLDMYNVLKMAAGCHHSVVLTAKGRVLTFGSNFLGQLGLGDLRKCSTPRLIGGLENVYLIGCGLVHTVAVSKDQRLYSWGRRMQPPPQYDRSRQERRKRPPGYPPKTSYNNLAPSQVSCEVDSKMIQICSGACHCLLVTEAGNVYAWGANDCGQLGWETQSGIYAIQQKPKPVNSLGKRTRLVACGDQFTVALDADNHVWVWGREDEGQLGMELKSISNGSNCKLVAKPTLLKGLPSQRKKANAEAEEFQQDADDILDSASILGEPDWDSLPDFGSLDPPQSVYDDNALREALKALHGDYGMERIVSYLTAWEDWKTLAYLHEQNKNWPQCLKYLMKNLGAHKDAKPAVAEIYDAISFCTRAVESQDIGPVELRAQAAQLLEQMSLFWLESRLEVSDLEEILKEHMSVYGAPLCEILFCSTEERSTGMSQESFSAKFQLKVLAYITSQSSELMETRQDRVSADGSGFPYRHDDKEKLWSEILSNLNKDLDRRSQIVLHGLPSRGELSGSLDMVCFTTGKAYEKEYFDQVVLPQFRQQLKRVPGISVSSAKMLADHFQYSQQLAAASPDVVFDSIQYESNFKEAL